jgi:hypothetical protein
MYSRIITVIIIVVLIVSMCIIYSFCSNKNITHGGVSPMAIEPPSVLSMMVFRVDTFDDPYRLLTDLRSFDIERTKDDPFLLGNSRIYDAIRLEYPEELIQKNTYQLSIVGISTDTTNNNEPINFIYWYIYDCFGFKINKEGGNCTLKAIFEKEPIYSIVYNEWDNAKIQEYNNLITVTHNNLHPFKLNFGLSTNMRTVKMEMSNRDRLYLLENQPIKFIKNHIRNDTTYLSVFVYDTRNKLLYLPNTFQNNQIPCVVSEE